MKSSNTQKEKEEEHDIHCDLKAYNTMATKYNLDKSREKNFNNPPKWVDIHALELSTYHPTNPSYQYNPVTLLYTLAIFARSVPVTPMPYHVQLSDFLHKDIKTKLSSGDFRAKYVEKYPSFFPEMSDKNSDTNAAITHKNIKKYHGKMKQWWEEIVYDIGQYFDIATTINKSSNIEHVLKKMYTRVMTDVYTVIHEVAHDKGPKETDLDPDDAAKVLLAVPVYLRRLCHPMSRDNKEAISISSNQAKYIDLQERINGAEQRVLSETFTATRDADGKFNIKSITEYADHSPDAEETIFRASPAKMNKQSSKNYDTAISNTLLDTPSLTNTEMESEDKNMSPALTRRRRQEKKKTFSRVVQHRCR
jgi:hypothetical protein